MPKPLAVVPELEAELDSLYAALPSSMLGNGYESRNRQRSAVRARSFGPPRPKNARFCMV